MKVVYLAHPVGADTRMKHEANLARARRWFRWVTDKGHAVIADWIIECEIWSDFDSKHRGDGLKRDDATITRCDEFWMVGGRISGGMRRGQTTATRRDIPVIDLTYLGEEPPE